MNTEILKEAGIDYEAGLARFLNNISFYENVLDAFARETALDRAKAAYRSDDIPALLEAAHEVKGSSGNVGLVNVFLAAGALTALLRKGDFSKEELDTAFSSFETTYRSAQQAIRRALEE